VLSDNGRRTRPKHVVEVKKSACEKCRVYCDKNWNSYYTHKGADDSKIYLWPVWLYHIFPHYMINGMTSGKKLLNLKSVFCFSLQLLSETFIVLRKIQRDIFINVHRSCKVPVVLVRF
jgi:hypothetical protein